jgi:hypothetical protein
MLTIEITESATGTKTVGELRKYTENTAMMVLVKDFLSAELQSVIFEWDGSKFVSLDGKYESDFQYTKEYEEANAPSRLVRHPKPGH